MVFFNLFPLGILQLGDSVANGYWHARSLEFFQTHTWLEWMRLPGDVLFIAGVVPVVYLTARAVFRRRPMPEPEPAGVEPQGIPLFREVVSGNTPGGEARPAGGCHERQ
jgi:nitric oxide reductase subunit B